MSDLFNDGDKLDALALKGRGFAGVMKKYNFAGFIRTHGTTSSSVTVAPSVLVSPQATS